MPPREWKLRIEDMLEAIQRVQHYTQGMTLDSFSADEKTIDAVVRNFEVLGEAARHVPEDVQKNYPGIPWSKIRGMRHMLAHEYFGINKDIIWKTVVSDLVPLVPELRKALKEG